MSPEVAKFHSETGWDALSDGLPMVVRVMSGPASLDELAEAMGERDLVVAQRKLRRLIREGIIVESGERYEAPARLIDTDRQEGLLTSIARLVMPTVTRLANDPSVGYVAQIDLDMDEAEQEAFCAAYEQDLVEALNEASEVPADERHACSWVIFGTSDVPPNLPPQQRLLETLKRCALQRSTPGVASRAMLRYSEGRYGSPATAESLIRGAAEKMKQRAAGRRYTLVYGFCANGRIDGDER